MKRLGSLLFSLVAVGCSSSSTGGSSGVASSSSGGGLPLAGGALDGTWDVVVTRPNGSESTGTLTISPTLFAMDFGSFVLNGAVNDGVPNISVNNQGTTTNLASTLDQATFDTGALSYPVGGKWGFAGQSTERCTADIKVPSMSLDCQSMPSLTRGIQGSSSAQRTATLGSSFGELGGKWNVLLPKSTCEATVEGNTFTATCSDAVQKLTMNVDGSTASGTWDDVAEISAKRR